VTAVADLRDVHPGTKLREPGTHLPVFTVDRIAPTGAWVVFPGEVECRAFFVNPLLKVLEIVPGTTDPGRAA
jgi:hypothetical protein